MEVVVVYIFGPRSRVFLGIGSHCRTKARPRGKPLRSRILSTGSGRRRAGDALPRMDRVRGDAGSESC